MRIKTRYVANSCVGVFAVIAMCAVLLMRLNSAPQIPLLFKILMGVFCALFVGYCISQYIRYYRILIRMECASGSEEELMAKLKNFSERN